MEFNLDIARAEVARDPHTVTIGDKQFEFPPEIPGDVFDCLNDGRVGQALRELFGDRYDEAKTAGGGLSAQDLARVVNSLYGLDIPESSASDDSSGSGGMSSRQTSSGSTASTSRKRSGTPTVSDAAASAAS